MKRGLIRKGPDAGKDWRQKKGAAEDETVRQYYWLNGHELEPTLGESSFPCSSVGKESACNAGDLSLIIGSKRFPGEGHDNPLQYSCLGPWRATVHGIARVRHDLTTKPPLGDSEGQGSLASYSPWDCRVGNNKWARKMVCKKAKLWLTKTEYQLKGYKVDKLKNMNRSL